MSQYQVRTGPIQNDAAGIDSAMVQGSAPPRSRARQGPRTPPPGFIDVPAFNFESVLASRLDSRNHITRPRQALPLAQTTHVQAPFVQSMVQSVLPPRHRISAGRQIGQPIAQPTHVEAPFIEPMIRGVTAPRNRIRLGRQIGQPLGFNVLGFQFETVLASCLDSRRHLYKPQQWNPLSQTTHVAAAIVTPMFAGVTSPRPRLPFSRRIDPFSITVTGDFAFESVFASRLDSRNHLYRPPQWNPFSQTTPIAAALDAAMTAGVIPSRHRILRPRQIGQPLWADVTSFAFESVFASRLDQRYHLRRPQYLPPISQLTHVPAPFSIEMVSSVKSLRPIQHWPYARAHQFPSISVIDAAAFLAAWASGSNILLQVPFGKQA